MQSRPVALRVYVVATGDSYNVMPGGLTRVASSGDTVDVSLDYSGGSKDTWVLADDRGEHEVDHVEPGR